MVIVVQNILDYTLQSPEYSRVYGYSSPEYSTVYVTVFQNILEYTVIVVQNI